MLCSPFKKKPLLPLVSRAVALGVQISLGRARSLRAKETWSRQVMTQLCRQASFMRILLCLMTKLVATVLTEPLTN